MNMGADQCQRQSVEQTSIAAEDWGSHFNQRVKEIKEGERNVPARAPSLWPRPIARN